MKYLKLFEKKITPYKDFVNEAIKFKLSDELDGIISNVENKKKAQVIESMLIKSILTNFLSQMKTMGVEIDKSFSSMNTQQKLDYLLNIENVEGALNRTYRQKLVGILDYVRTNNITANNFEDLYQKATIWHDEMASGATKEREDTRTVRKDETSNTDKFIEYPNGWYWINLNTSYSGDEASNMGHCGNDSGKILFSLRDNNSNSHVTVSYNESEQSLNQCKGRGNTKPKDVYHKYILDLLYNEKYPINLIITGSYKPELDFNLMDLTDDERDELLTKKPELEYTDNMFENYFENDEWLKVASMVENGFDYSGDKKCMSIDLLKFVINQKLDRNAYIDSDWYKPSLDLQSTKEDVEFYKEFYNDNVIHSKMANNVYILWKHGILKDAEAEAAIIDLKIKEGKWYIKWNHNSWSDFSFMYSGDSMDGSGSYSYEEYVKRNLDDIDRGYHDFSLSDCDLDDLTLKTKTAILENIEEKNIVLEAEEIEELLGSDEDFGFESVEDYSFEKVKNAILADKGGDTLKELLSLDSYSDIKDNVVRGYEEAQEDADESEMFDTVVKPIKDFFNFENYDWYEGNLLLLEFDPDWAILLNRATDNGRYLETLTKIVEELFDTSTREDAYNFGIEEEEFPEFFKFRYPYNGWSGSVDDDNLNDRVVDRLE